LGSKGHIGNQTTKTKEKFNYAKKVLTMSRVVCRGAEKAPPPKKYFGKRKEKPNKGRKSDDKRSQATNSRPEQAARGKTTEEAPIGKNFDEERGGSRGRSEDTLSFTRGARAQALSFSSLEETPERKKKKRQGGAGSLGWCR